MYIAYAEECWKQTQGCFLHVKDVETKGYDGAFLICEDKDVFVLGG